MDVDPGLQSLFVLLRNAGIVVGLEEIRRLGAVFATGRSFDEHELRQVVEAVCIKSLEQRAVFRRAYDKWFEVVGKQLAQMEARRRTTSDGHKKKRIRSKGALLVAAKKKDADEADEDDESAPTEVEVAAHHLPGGGGAMVPEIDTVIRKGLHFPVVQSAAPSLVGDPARVIAPGEGPKRASVRGLTILLLMAAVAVGVWYGQAWWPSGTDPLDSPMDADGGTGAAHIDSAGAMIRSYQPEVEVYWPPGPPLDFAAYGLIAASLGFAAWLLLRRGRGRWLPEVERAPAAHTVVMGMRAPSRRRVGTLFLDAEDEENLVWGVGRFVSEEQSRDLDIERTVTETAAAFGRPVLRYEAARYHHEVWLWVDESLDSPEARHLARDLARTLEGSGLPVVISSFWGVPNELRMSSDEVLTLDQLDAQRESSAVAILTDGRLMSAAHRALDRSGELHALLRNLSFWPRVTFIDFSRERGRLGAIVEPHGLRVIAPHDAPAAVSDLAEGGDRTEYGRLVGDARVWAAACALSPRPVDDPTALALRQLLDLEVTPWAIQTLRERAEYRAGGLSWSSRGRAALLSWLLDAEELPDKGMPPPGSLVARITAAWDRLFGDREQQALARAARDGDSRELDLLRMERAFVHLWDRPEEAARTLYAFRNGPLAATIRHHLGELAPRECADREGAIPLPWALRHQTRETQVMLGEMGLGREAGLGARRSLPRPGRLMLALCMCLGLGGGAIYGLVEDYASRETPPPEQVSDWPVGARPPFVEVYELGEQRWQVRVWTPWSEEVTAAVESGQQYLVRGTEARLACVERVNGVEVRRCCQDQRAVARAGFAERWSFAALREVPYARDLAEMLLCSGSADAVYLVGPTAEMPDWSGWAQGRDDGQLLVVDEAVPDDLSEYRGRALVVSTLELGRLLDLTRFDGVASVRERVSKLEPLAGDGTEFSIQGLGECGGRGQPCCSPNETYEYCEGRLSCVEGTCREVQICEPRTARCEGNTVMQCDRRGVDEQAIPCGPDQVCFHGVCETPQRVDGGGCTPGERQCSAGDGAVDVCTPDGHALRLPCPAGSVCRAGDCVAIAWAEVELHVSPPGKKLPPWALELVCEVGGRRQSWSAAELDRPRSHTLRIPRNLAAQGGSFGIEIDCWLRASRVRVNEQVSRHPWHPDSEGKYVMTFERVPGLRIDYALRLHLVELSQQRRPEDWGRNKSTGAHEGDGVPGE
ncbi:hypothetical protein [Haliangium sp.]|uniref:hypothetical protein n=1 Tax=Haliangium sp. TaxID=2663208 RepID=UPI003D09E78C